MQYFTFGNFALVAGFIFFLLAFPLAVQFLIKFKIPISQSLERLDRAQYHLILLALPFFTLGILVKVLLFANQQLLRHPEEVIAKSPLAQTVCVLWLASAIFLYMRIFWGWRYRRSALLYFIGLFMLFLIQLSY